LIIDNISIFTAFVAGLLTFFSPCVFPLIPSYVLFIAGVSFEEINNLKKVETKIIINSLLFILGFSLVFISLGAAASLIGTVLFNFRSVLRIIGGVIIFILGLYISGFLKIPLMDMECRLNIRVKPKGYLSSVLIGATFAFAWTPCVGPIVGSMLVLAGTEETISKGVLLLISYSIGLAIPFLLTAIGINSSLVYFKKMQKYIPVIKLISGIFLIIVGVLLITDYFSIISSYFTGISKAI